MQLTRYTVESPRSPIVISVPSSLGAIIGGRWYVKVRDQILTQGRIWFRDGTSMVDSLRATYQTLANTPGYGAEAEDLRQLVAIFDKD